MFLDYLNIGQIAKRRSLLAISQMFSSVTNKLYSFYEIKIAEIRGKVACFHVSNFIVASMYMVLLIHLLGCTRLHV